MARITLLVITDPGCEEICKKEVLTWGKYDVETTHMLLRFECELEEGVQLAYQLQTACRVLVEIQPRIQELEELEALEPDSTLLKQLVPEGATFKVTSESVVDKFMGQELSETFGGWIHNNLGWRANLSKPDTVIHVIATEEGIYTGVDLIGKPLAKRDWRIMLSSRSLKATIAAAVAIYADVKSEEVILDPVADDGTIAIETALFLTKTSPRKFERIFAFQKFPSLAIDWTAWKKEQDELKKEIIPVRAYSKNLKEMKAVRMNSKLGGIDKDITSTKIALDWLDLKIEEKSIDKILTHPTTSGKSISVSQATKQNDDLFNQAAHVLKGTMTCLTDKPEEILPSAEKYGFKVLKRQKVWMGKRAMEIIEFGGV